MLLVLFRTILLACFAVWFGGFFFYTAVVVTIGTEVLGSALDQGMITRKVTVWLNIVAAIAVFLMIIESLIRWRKTGPIARCTLLASAVLIAIGTAALAYLHPMLDGLINPETMEISDHDYFYGLHRIYLWVSTFQWIVGWIWLIAFAWIELGPGKEVIVSQ